MQKLLNEYIYSPSDLTAFLESEFVTWMDRYKLESPGKVQPDPPNEEAQLLFNKGHEHEKSFLEHLYREGFDVCEILGVDDRLATTHKAIQDGREIIYQAELFKLPFRGYADFLFRVDEPSLLGSYSYEIGDTKLSKRAKPSHIIQLCCYAEMLESIQGSRPRYFRIILGNKEVKHFRTDDFYYYYLKVKEAFLIQQNTFKDSNMPEPLYGEDFKHWTSYAEGYLEKIDHLSRVANITRTQIRRLEDAGIRTLTSLATTQLTHIPKMEPRIFGRLHQQAKLQMESKNSDKPIYEVLSRPDNPEITRYGLELLPPSSPNDIFFDMEGYPLIDGGLEYLFGATYLENGQPSFKDWWAYNPTEEKAAFEGFIDWAYNCWIADPLMHIYHYASYEVTAMRKLMGRYGTREQEVDELLRNEVFVDLYKVVSQGLRVGEPSYSIKNIEHLYRDIREGDIKTASASVVYYEKWLEIQDGRDWQTSKILNEIREYNRVDCESTWQLAEWLRSVQKINNITWIPYVKDGGESDTEEETSVDIAIGKTPAELAREILVQIPPNRSEKDEEWRIQELLAWLLEFHRREDKPKWWAYFDRQNKTDEELVDDPECLAMLQRTDQPAELLKRSKAFEYWFNSDQETKRKPGDKCYFLFNGKEIKNIEILSIDTNEGLVTIKLGPKALKQVGSEPPQQINLMPIVEKMPNTVAQGIYRVVNHWWQTGELPQALADFLYRKPPNLIQPQIGALIPIDTPIKSFKDAVLKVVESLNNSTLCIQGPPGSGKSSTASHVILNLIKQGYRVGITSNSHKAINNLMEKVAQLAQYEEISLNGVKICSKEEDQVTGYISIVNIDSIKQISISSDNLEVRLIGGTAWAFSHEFAEGIVDYLFVDEAGQVSLANLVGMSRSTRNIVLLGDQMQLGQPIQGSHPGESGQSILEYYLQGEATIPPEKGIFLSTTYRLHPEICEFISEAVYEGRLKSNETETRKHLISFPTSLSNGNLLKEAGILYCPVSHEGNTQSSIEESKVIQQLVIELLKCHTTDSRGQKRLMTFEDILIVAPYNMQVRLLQESLGVQARVGSVDKFQGQEAPVVIVSMCASSGNESTRGLEFLLCKNRINVAISRAKNLAIVVGSPTLALTRCSNIEQISLVNLFCWITEEYSARLLPEVM